MAFHIKWVLYHKECLLYSHGISYWQFSPTSGWKLELDLESKSSSTCNAARVESLTKLSSHENKSDQKRCKLQHKLSIVWSARRDREPYFFRMSTCHSLLVWGLFMNIISQQLDSQQILRQTCSQCWGFNISTEEKICHDLMVHMEEKRWEALAEQINLS